MNAFSKTLIATYTDPVTKSLEWRRIKAMPMVIGCRVIEGNGSRVRFARGGIVGTSTTRTRRRKQNPIGCAMRCNSCILSA